MRFVSDDGESYYPAHAGRRFEALADRLDDVEAERDRALAEVASLKQELHHSYEELDAAHGAIRRLVQVLRDRGLTQ